MTKYADVAVDAPVGYGRTFTYSVPLRMVLSPGHLVQVPFGPGFRMGVVFHVSDEPRLSETREVTLLAHMQPLLSPNTLALAKWISDYYRAPLFLCAALMMPPGYPMQIHPYLFVSDTTMEDKFDVTQRKVLDYIRAKGKVKQDSLWEALGPGVEKALNSLVGLGVVSHTWELQPPRVNAKYVTCLEMVSSLFCVDGVAASLLSRAPRQADFLQHLASMDTPITLADAQKEFGISAVKGLENRGIAKRVRLHVERDPLRGKEFSTDSPPSLTNDQRFCVDQIEWAIDSSASKVFLLHGVTGSGKTEIYLRALDHAMKKGKRGIVMVPELSLTPQTIERFGRRFPGQVAVLHSGLSAGQRFDQWWRISGGDYSVVVGSRGAVFAPQPDLGIIVIDEEHEWTYKQGDSVPRYHGRDVAIKLAELTGAVVILGSATPDVVSRTLANNGTYQLLALPKRVGARWNEEHGSDKSLPYVRLVDLRQELRDGNRSIFSRALSQSMSHSLQAGEQVILYLNRRGSGSLVQCRDCGHTIRCRRCDVPLAYHAQGDKLLCHQCNYRVTAPDVCQICRSPRVRHLGLGTQRVMEEVYQAFPGVKAIRWDRDAASAKGAHENIMNSFAKGDAQVLVGTQMIAKGLHFPGVTLVGVLCADIGLFVPDFHAGERVFQLLCQVAGRTGRGPLGGQVIIQAYSTQHYAVLAASAQDYDRFYQEETTYRREQGLPPFGRLIRLVYSHPNQSQCQREVERLGRSLKVQMDIEGITDVDILGPAPAYSTRLRGRYRWHLILRGQNPRYLLEKIPIPKGWSVDIDPISVA